MRKKVTNQKQKLKKTSKQQIKQQDKQNFNEGKVYILMQY